MKTVIFFFSILFGSLSICAQNDTKIPSDIQQWLNEELARVPDQTLSSSYSDAFFNEAPTRLIGYAKDYNPESEALLGNLYVEDVIVHESYPVLIEFMPDGKFVTEISLTYPVYTYLKINDETFISFYIEPGSTLAMIIEPDKTVSFQGQLAEINQELQLLESSVRRLNPYFVYNEGREMLPMDFKAEYTRQYKEYQARLNEFIDKTTISGRAQEINKFDALIMYAAKLLEYVMLNDGSGVTIPNEYYDFLSELPLDNTLLLTARQYSAFLNRLEFSDRLRLKEYPAVYETLPEKTFLEFLQEETPSLTPMEIEIANFYNMIMITNRYDQKCVQFFQNNEDAIQSFQEKFEKQNDDYNTIYLDSLRELPSYKLKLIEWERKDKLLADSLGLQSSLTYEIIKMRSLPNTLANLEIEEARSYINEMKMQLTHPYLRKTADKLLETKINKSVEEAYELPEGKGTDIFREIINNHKGKYVLVDFWATTCGPCIGAMRDTKATREKYKDHPEIDFVFITGDHESPEDAYVKMIEEYGLHHSYRLPHAQYAHLPVLFKFSGIPRYVLVDKDGRIISDNFWIIRFNAEQVIEDLLSTNNK